MNNSLLDLIAAGEGPHLEFKESIDKNFLEEVCAFANSRGGRILIGVSDSGEIKGCNTDNRSRSLIQDTLRSIQPPLKISIEAVNNLFVISVPEGMEKPYSCPKGFYIRNGANSQKLNRNEIVELFQKEGRIHFDELRNDRAAFDEDFDSAAFDTFIATAGISRTIDKIGLLKNLNCLTEEGAFTNTGVLFFTKNIDFIMNNAVVVCVLYKGVENVQIIDKKDFTGNLIDNINNAIAFVQRHTNLEYVIKATRRENVPEIPEVAIRETIINAVCHRDYFDRRANVLIEIYDDRVIVSNPGGLPNGLKPEDFGKRSLTRNQNIASLLHRIHYIEKIGTGISRIRKAVEEGQKTTVEFKYDDTFFIVTFFRKTSTTNTAVVETVTETVTETVAKILEAISKKPNITRTELSQVTGLSVRGVEWNLTKLKKLGKLKRIGPNKGGYWVITMDNASS